jgi:hypothetical protein
VGRNGGQPRQSLRDTASRCAVSNGHAWLVRELLGARRWRLPPRSAVSQVNYIRDTATSGEIGRCAADVHITRHSVKSARSLRCASFLGPIPRCAGPCGLNGIGVMSCAPSRLPSQHVRLEGASSGQRHGVRAYGAYGRALPSVSMNAQHSQGYRARYGARAFACRRASPLVSVNATPTPSLHAVQGENPPCTA